MFEEYVDFVKKIMKKTGIMITGQLVIMLRKKYKLDDDTINKVMVAAEKSGYVIISTGGYCITKNLYQTWTHDKFYDNLVKNAYVSRLGNTMKIYEDSPDYEGGNAIYREIGEKTFGDLLKEHREYLSVTKALWLVADAMPFSENFEVSGGEIFPIGYVHEEEGNAKFIQIGYFPTSRFDHCVSRMILMDAERLLNNSMKDCVIRVAIVTDERDVISIPYLGFKYFYMIVSKDVSPNRIVKLDYERSEEERWKDCRSNA